MAVRKLNQWQKHQDETDTNNEEVSDIGEQDAYQDFPGPSVKASLEYMKLIFFRFLASFGDITDGIEKIGNLMRSIPPKLKQGKLSDIM